MSKQRRKFVCPKCKEDYTLLVDPETHPELEVQCPFCNTTHKFDLSQQPVEELYRGGLRLIKHGV